MDLRRLFSLKQSDSAANGSSKRDPRKAERFFEHAQTVADAHNYDYAIECFISGLRHDPDNMKQHEALREVALRRKVGGGKPAGITERFQSPGPAAVDRMLQVETLWAKDPFNTKLMREFMLRSVEADEAEPELNLAEPAHWAGTLFLEFAAKGHKANKSALIAVRDLFARIGAFDKAVEACKMVLRLNPDNAELLMDLKNLEAERTMQVGGYTEAAASGEGGFRHVVRDAEKQVALDQEDRIVKRTSDIDQVIERRRAEYQENPEDLDRTTKLVDALLSKDEDEPEQEAVALLEKAWEQSGQYRYKMRMGDVRMRMYNRKLRQLRQELAKAEKAQDQAGVENLKRQITEVNRERLAFELDEYQQRADQYPTDLGIRYELGRRLFYEGRIDEAIGAFQQAKSDPKHRAAAYQYLGTCYIRKEWLEEAIETLRTGVKVHPDADDRLGLELRYLLMDALERRARSEGDAEAAREAQKIASQILQTKIDFRDIQQRLEKLRQLVHEFDAKAES